MGTSSLQLSRIDVVGDLGIYYNSPLLSAGDKSQDPLRVPETEDSTKPYTYDVFFYTNIPTIKFNL